MQSGRSRHLGNALHAQSVYDGITFTADTTEEDAERMCKERERWDSVADAMKTIADAVNSGSPDVVAQMMYMGLEKEHRTLQAQTVCAMIKFMSIYKDAAYDLRNRAAVGAAEQVAQFVEGIKMYIPLI